MYEFYFYCLLFTNSTTKVKIKISREHFDSNCVHSARQYSIFTNRKPLDTRRKCWFRFKVIPFSILSNFIVFCLAIFVWFSASVLPSNERHREREEDSKRGLCACVCVCVHLEITKIYLQFCFVRTAYESNIEKKANKTSGVVWQQHIYAITRNLDEFRFANRKAKRAVFHCLGPIGQIILGQFERFLFVTGSVSRNWMTKPCEQRQPILFDSMSCFTIYMFLCLTTSKRTNERMNERAILHRRLKANSWIERVCAPCTFVCAICCNRFHAIRFSFRPSASTSLFIKVSLKRGRESNTTETSSHWVIGLVIPRPIREQIIPSFSVHTLRYMYALLVETLFHRRN